MDGFAPEPPRDLMDEPIEAGSRLIIIGGADRGQEFVLGDGDTSLGRGLDNDIVLADIAVSRKHTLVCREGGRFVVRDLGSGNGTLVNGQRMETQVLADGDQIELGNTLLRFVSAGEIVPETGEVFAPETGELIDEGRGGFDLPPESVAEATPTADEALIAPPVRTEPRRRGTRRPLKLLIYGGAVVVVLLVAMLGIKLLINRNRAPAPADQQVARSAAASRHFDRGRRFLVTRDWEKARDEFIRVYALAPGFEHAKRYVKQASAEMRARAAVEGAKQALSERAYDRARAKLAEVPSTSVYATEVPELKRRADDKQLSELIASAGEQRNRGEVEAALKAVELGLQIAPADQRFKQLHAELTQELDVAQGKSTGASRRAARGKVRVARTGTRKVSATAGGRRRSPRVIRRRQASRDATIGKAMTLYERSEWEAAVVVLRSGEETLEGAAKKRASRLASDINKVASYTKRAQASQTTNSSKAMRYYQLAMELDKRISGGHHKGFFRKRLYKVARMQAIGSASTGRYTAAYRALEVAKRHGTADAQLEKVSATLEKKAMELFTKGYTLRRTNPVQARQTWQRVLHMVPPNSDAYQKAYEWLNRSGPSYQDEDED